MQFGHPYYQKIDALLPRRSLLVMTGESRYLWTHRYIKHVSIKSHHTTVVTFVLLPVQSVITVSLLWF